MQYDYAIIGAGVSGISLLNSIINSQIKDRSIIVFEPNIAQLSARTICFWSKEKTMFDQIIESRYQNLSVNFDDESITQQILPYSYNVISGVHLLNHARSTLLQGSNVHFVEKFVLRVTEADNSCVIETDLDKITASWVFDSRPPFETYPPIKSNKTTYLSQHFIGAHISTDEKTDPTIATFMDFRNSPEPGGFYYVLPQKNSALVMLVTPHIQDISFVHSYIKDILKISEYKIVTIEKGMTPLTNHKFTTKHGKRIRNVGMRAGMIKPTSGYGFTRILKDSQQIVDSLTRYHHPFHKTNESTMSRWTDSLFLKVIDKYPFEIQPIYKNMFQKNSLSEIFKFLDGDSSLTEIIRLGVSLPKKTFISELISKK